MKRIAGYAVLVVLGLIASLALLNRRDQTVGFSQEIQYDDFAFSVLQAKKVQQLVDRNSSVEPAGNFYVITLKVANHAKRVPFIFDQQSAMVVDETGRRYHVAPLAQTILETTQTTRESCASSIPAGESCTTDLAFEVPADFRESHVRISTGNSVGEVLDFIFWGDKKISLK